MNEVPADDRQDAEAQPPQPPQADIGTALGQRVLICDGAMGTMLHAGRDAGRAGIEMAAELLAEAGALVQGTVLALPGTDPAALDRLLDAVP